MKQEQWKQEFPRMPDAIRARIAREVEVQMRTDRAGEAEPETGRNRGFGLITAAEAAGAAGRRRRRWTARRIAIAAAAAVLACGGTVFAATQLYRMNLNKQSEYSVTMSVVAEAGDAAEQAAGTDGAASLSADAFPAEVPAVTLRTGDMPAGLEDNSADKGQTSWADPEDQYGFFIGEPVLVDVAEPLQLDHVRNAENVKVGERDAVYVDQQFTEDTSWSWQDLYILFPDVDRIVMVSAWGHASRDDLMQIAEQIDLEPTGEMVARETLDTWSDAVKNMQPQPDEAGEPEVLRQTATEDEMANLHQVGDTVTVDAFSEEGSDAVPLQARVTDVQFADDLSLLTREDQIQDSWKELAGSDGTLGPVTVNHIRYGDGVDSLDEVVRTETRPVKLVYVTLDYTNDSDQDLQNVWYYSSLLKLTHADGSWQIKSLSCDDCDGISETPAPIIGEMLYSDVTGGERSNNYIPELKAGETVTVHMAYLVGADETDDLYLAINGQDWYEFDDQMLETGLVKLDAAE